MALWVGSIVLFFIVVLYLRHDNAHSKGDTTFRNDHEHQDDLDMAVFMVEHEHHDDHDDSDPVDYDDFESWDN